MWPFRRVKKPKIAPDAQHVVIIGNGITGVTAALTIRERQPTWRITMISGESKSFYSRPALMYIYMGHMRLADTQPYEEWFWDEKGIDRVVGWVRDIDTENRRLTIDGADDLAYDKLLIATGSTPNKFGWPGQDLERVQGLYTLQDVEALERIGNDLEHGVIVGGGLIGIELAEMLLSRGAGVTMLARETNYWNNALPDEEAKMVNRVARDHGVDLRLSTELEEIVDDGKGRACAVTTKGGDRVDCQVVGLTAGVRPNVAWLKETKIETGRGVLVDDSFRTKIDGVFAAGDCAEIERPGDERNVIEQLWYTGKMHGRVVGEVIAGGESTYDRGIWFNSAKFFDLEWHTYGRVTPAVFPRPEGEKHLWWSDGQSRGLRVVLDAEGAVKGMNGMGLRHRHRVWEKWIREKRDLDYVLAHLHEANFDPEFFKKVESEIRGGLKEQAA